MIYSDWLVELKSRYRSSRVRAAVSVNAEMLKLYWSIGADIVRMEKDQPWGSKFLQRLSEDLRATMPDAHCFSETNLRYMKYFHLLYLPSEFRPQLEDKIHPQLGDKLNLAEFIEKYPNVTSLMFAVPWGHHKYIIDKFGSDQASALFYVRKTIENGWSRAMLEANIASNLHMRIGQAETNFDVALTNPDTELAKELLKDPYDFSFLSMDERYREEELKSELIKNIELFLQELGKGFSYLGREYKLMVGDTQRAIDMLFYNVFERRYYVIEVKVKKFEPADIGQIGTYMVAVNRQLKKPDDQQTVGLVICREKDRVTVQYALESSALPIGVSDYVLERFIPENFKSQLPSIEEVESALTLRLAQ